LICLNTPGVVQDRRYRAVSIRIGITLR